MEKSLIRVTTLEAYRRFRDCEVIYTDGDGFDTYASEEDVIANVTGEFKGSEYTRIGTSFHSIIETGKPKCVKLPAEKKKVMYRGNEIEVDVPEGREFDIDGFKVKLDVNQCKVAMRYRNEHPHASHEVRVFKDYGEAVVTGCADMVDGLDIRDIKTKYGRIKDEDYTHSCQWRFYLDMFSLDWFYFDLFHFNGYDKDRNGYDVRGLTLTRYEPPIWVQRYPRIHQDNTDLVHDFMEWCQNKGLTEYLNKNALNR
jgi:hypothetical protein